MIKILLLFMLFGSISYIGFESSKIYKSKENFFCDLLSFTKSIKTEISFLKTDILEMINKNKYESKFNDFLIEYKNALKNDKSLSKSNITEILKNIIDLKDDEIESISQMFFELGNIGYNEQLERLEYYIETYINFYNQSNENSKKMMPLCKKMGILTGILVCIVLI